MMLEAEYWFNKGKRGLRYWRDTDVKGSGMG